jgi:hypothetical protein
MRFKGSCAERNKSGCALVQSDVRMLSGINRPICDSQLQIPEFKLLK